MLSSGTISSTIIDGNDIIHDIVSQLIMINFF